MKILLCDDHAAFLDALAGGLSSCGHEVVASCAGPEAIVQLVLDRTPEVCLLDMNLGDASALPSAVQVRSQRPEVALVLLTGSAQEAAWRAWDEGIVDGLVSKLASLSALHSAITRVGSGERVIEKFQRPATANARSVLPANLTPRERAIVSLIVSGASTAEMSEALEVSVHTVRTHVKNVLHKFGATSRRQVSHLVHETSR